MLDRLLKMYKIEPSAFSNRAALTQLIRDTEDMYAVHFGECYVSDPYTATDMGMGT